MPKYSAEDFTRCAKCGRLLLKSSATSYLGRHYGPECVGKAFDSVTMTDEEWFENEQKRQASGG